MQQHSAKSSSAGCFGCFKRQAWDNGRLQCRYGYRLNCSSSGGNRPWNGPKFLPPVTSDELLCVPEQEVTNIGSAIQLSVELLMH